MRPFVFLTSVNHQTGSRCHAIMMYVLYSRTRLQTAFIRRTWWSLWWWQKTKTIQKTRLSTHSRYRGGLPKGEASGQRCWKHSHHSTVSRIGSGYKQLKTVSTSTTYVVGKAERFHRVRLFNAPVKKRLNNLYARLWTARIRRHLIKRYKLLDKRGTSIQGVCVAYSWAFSGSIRVVD